MPKRSALLISLLVGLASAGLAACGSSGDRPGLLRADDADGILRRLDRIDGLAAEGKCNQAAAEARDLVDRAQKLDPTVRARLREALVDGSQRLRLLVETPEKCKTETETVPTETQPTETQPQPTETVTVHTEPPPTETEPPGSAGGGVGPPPPATEPAQPPPSDGNGTVPPAGQ